MDGSSSHTVYCVDASACAVLSEDFPGTTRLHFQRELVACHSGAPARCPPAELALVATAGGRASVVLHPSAEPGAVRAALDNLQASGEASLESALKLALLVSRRFPAGATHVTAFVASAAAPASLAVAPGCDAAAELRQRYAEAGVSLDVAVLCPRDELGPAAVQALEALACSDDSSSSGGNTEQAGAEEAGEGGASPASPSSGSSGSSANRLLWLTPVDSAAESWQQLEPALEQLERRRASASPQAVRSGGGGSGAGVSVLPRRISRAPRQLDGLRQPRASLLAARSGVQQPALCRGESLNRLGHLSSDGMMRSWLPTYSSLGQQQGVRMAAAGGGGLPGPADAAGMVYVEVQPIPRWRTLLKVTAGRMLPEPPAGASGGSSPTAGYASASSQLLRSLEALSVLDEGEEGEGGSSSTAAAPAPAPVRYRADSARGVLRLLQGTKEPHLLKLVWSPDRPAPAAAAAGSDSRQQHQQQQVLDMFGGGSSAAGSSGGASARHAELLSYMPASTVAASAARGPIIREGCELWETASEWAWELSLPTPEPAAGKQPAASGSSSGGSSSNEGSEVEAPVLPACLEARELPNGAQVLVVTPTSGPGQRRRQARAAAFWLQQRLQADSLAPPAYCSRAAEQPAGSASQEQPEAAEASEGGAPRLAAALLRHLRAPPAVDIRQLRKDVKEGAVQVTPITLGPLPASLVRDLLGTRSRLMAGMGVDNLDSWDEPGAGTSGSGGASATAKAADEASASASASGAAAGGKAGGSGKGGAGTSAEEAAAAMQQNKAAVMSLLRERLLNRSGSGKRASSSGGGACSTGAGQEPAPAASSPAGAGMPAGTPEPSGAIPCTPQQPAAGDGFAGSYASSTGGTPFGTPLHIVPSLLHHAADGAAEGGADPGAAAGAAGAAGSGQASDAGAQLLPVGPKPPEGGSGVLVGGGGQGEGGDGEHLFQLE